MSAPRYEIKTRYDEAAYAALVHLMMKKLRRWPRLVILATGFVSVAGSAAVMFTQGVSLTGAIFLIAGNLMCMFGLFAPRIAVRMMIASNKKGEAPVNVYVFSDEGMRVRSSETEKEYSYGFIRRILEMSGYLFFFMRITPRSGNISTSASWRRAQRGGAKNDRIRQPDRPQV